MSTFWYCHIMGAWILKWGYESLSCVSVMHQMVEYSFLVDMMHVVCFLPCSEEELKNLWRLWCFSVTLLILYRCGGHGPPGPTSSTPQWLDTEWMGPSWLTQEPLLLKGSVLTLLLFALLIHELEAKRIGVALSVLHCCLSGGRVFVWHMQPLGGIHYRARGASNFIRVCTIDKTVAKHSMQWMSLENASCVSAASEENCEGNYELECSCRRIYHFEGCEIKRYV